MSDKRWTASQGSAPGADPFGELCRKVLLLVAEDRLALSNYRTLIGFLKEIALSVVVATRSSGRLAEIEELGVRVIDFDQSPPSLNPVREVSSAWAIGRVLEAEDPDVVHLVGLEPVILGGLASKLVPSRYVVVQMPGLAANEAADGNLPRLYHAGALRLMASMLRRPELCLLVENADDLTLLRSRGIDPGGRFAVLGGAGIDPQGFPALPAPNNATPVAAFVGQMVARNGIDILMRAGEHLAEARIAAAVGAVRRGRSREPGGDRRRRAGGLVHRARGAVAGPCGRSARGLEPRRHLRAAGAHGRRRAARAARGRCLRAAAGRDRRAGMPTFRARRGRGPDRAARGPGRARRRARSPGARPRDAPAHGRGGAAAAAARLHETHVRQSLRAAYASMLGKRSA